MKINKGEFWLYSHLHKYSFEWVLKAKCYLRHKTSFKKILERTKNAKGLMTWSLNAFYEWIYFKSHDNLVKRIQR